MCSRYNLAQMCFKVTDPCVDFMYVIMGDIPPLAPGSDQHVW